MLGGWLVADDADDTERLRDVALRNAQAVLVVRRRAEEELRKQSEWLRTTLASIGDAVVTTDADGRVTFLNAIAEGMTEWSQAEALGHFLPDVLRLVTSGTGEPVENPVIAALRTGEIVRLANHTILISRTGREQPIDDSAAPIRDADGAIVGAVLVFRDVSERKRSELARAHLAAIIESSDDAIISKTLEGVVRSWNAGAERLFGYTPTEAIGQPITFLIPPERLHEEAEILARIALGERVESFETVRVTKDGRRLDISLTVSPIRDVDGGQIIGASKIARDITARKRMEEALRQSDRHKDQFIALLAHELRNPLAPLRTALHVIRLAEGDPQRVRRAQDVMERQLNHMVRLVDDLLDISRISQNKIELRRESVLLADVINHAVETARPAIEAAGHELTISMPTTPIHLDADLTRLAQVFSNLLTNSAKYSDRGGSILIAAEPRDRVVTVSVRDTGIGIPPDALARIFDMFAQVDRVHERAKDGLGIGLALVKGLVEMHGGTVTAASEGPGTGSTFTVTLPLPTAVTAPVEAAQAAEPTAAGVRKRILVVDDNRDAADTLASMLDLMGHDVRVAYSGRGAVAAAEAFRPALIFIDIGMPDVNGYEATQQIRAQAWARNVRVIAVTGWGQEHDRTRSQSAGCDGHLMKPVEIAALQQWLLE